MSSTEEEKTERNEDPVESFLKDSEEPWEFIACDIVSDSERPVQTEEAGTEEDGSVSVDKMRQELAALRLQRMSTVKNHKNEVQQLEKKYRAAQKDLQHQLYSQRAHQTIYMRFLKHEYYEIEQRKAKEQAKEVQTQTQQAPVSTYVLQQEAPLLSAVHRTFWIYPSQEKITKKFYEENIHPYFEQELQVAQTDRDNIAIEEQVLRLAQENTVLYDSYRQRVEAQEIELRKLRKRLLASGKLGKEQELLPETHHTQTSMYSDTEDHDHSEASMDESPFVSVKKLLMTPTEQLSNSIGNNIHNLKMVASQKFQLPFGQ